MYTNKFERSQNRFYAKFENFAEFPILDDDLVLSGNIMINFKTRGAMVDSDLFRITFNTAFIGYKNKIVCNRW